VDPAGLKPQLHHSQIELRLLERLNGLMSTSLHKFYCLALQTMMDAMVDTLSQDMSTCTKTISQMRPALIIEPEDIPMDFSVLQLCNAKIAILMRNALSQTNTTSTE